MDSEIREPNFRSRIANQLFSSGLFFFNISLDLDQYLEWKKCFDVNNLLATKKNENDHRFSLQTSVRLEILRSDRKKFIRSITLKKIWNRYFVSRLFCSISFIDKIFKKKKKFNKTKSKPKKLWKKNSMNGENSIFDSKIQNLFILKLLFKFEAKLKWNDWIEWISRCVKTLWSQSFFSFSFRLDVNPFSMWKGTRWNKSIRIARIEGGRK